MRTPCRHVAYLRILDGKSIPVVGNEGESILEVAHKNKIDLEGACEGSLACSTCHVILPKGTKTFLPCFFLIDFFIPELYDQLSEPTDEEYDMLDLAFGLTETFVFRGFRIWN
jgi:ferredoxin